MNPFVLNNKRISNLYYGRYFYPNYNLNKEEQIIAFENLKEIAKEFDHVLSFDQSKPLSENIKNTYKIKKS